MKTTDSDSASVPDLNMFFRLAVAAVVVFVLTILALVAALFGNQQAPAARLLNNHGGVIIAVEVGAALLFAFLAMTVDRVRTLRKQARDTTSDRPPEDTPAVPPLEEASS